MLPNQVYSLFDIPQFFFGTTSYCNDVDHKEETLLIIEYIVVYHPFEQELTSKCVIPRERRKCIWQSTNHIKLPKFYDVRYMNTFWKQWADGRYLESMAHLIFINIHRYVNFRFKAFTMSQFIRKPNFYLYPIMQIYIKEVLNDILRYFDFI